MIWAIVHWFFWRSKQRYPVMYRVLCNLICLRDAPPHQNRWIFGDSPNIHWPPSPRFSKISWTFFGKRLTFTFDTADNLTLAMLADNLILRAIWHRTIRHQDSLTPDNLTPRTITPNNLTPAMLADNLAQRTIWHRKIWHRSFWRTIWHRTIWHQDNLTPDNLRPWTIWHQDNLTPGQFNTRQFETVDNLTLDNLTPVKLSVFASGVKLSAVSCCPCQIVRGVKVSYNGEVWNSPELFPHIL